MTKEDIDRIASEYFDDKESEHEMDEVFDLAKKALEKQMQEQETGHWITLKDEYGDVHEAVCSNCDKNGNHKWIYCPNCGAKMESEDKK